MRVELLGTVQVRDDAGGPAHVGGPRARALLALLALDAGRVVPAASLIDRLWDGEPPEGARGALQSMISRLRGVLGEVIESHPAGYRLAVGRDLVDALAFEELAGQGSRALAAGDPGRASTILREALALWRGPALAGLPAPGPAAGIAARLEELRRSATADRIEADLAAAAASDAAGLTAELRALVSEDPLAERPRALLMRALYIAGRQADALAVYADARTQLAAQLGVDPSPQLEQVYLGVLRRSLPEARIPARAGPSSEPAGSGPAAVPATTLRVPLTSLVGRDDQVAQVEALTGENRLITLTGPGGVGKTRLAVEVAARARDGVWLVDLAPLSDPGDVPYAVLTAVGIRDGLLAGARDSEPGQAAEPGPAAGPGPSGRLVSSLRERSGLIVLDNCEHLIEAVAKLADAVLSGCPGIRVLAASREALGITGETLCPVPPLPVPPEPGDGELAAIAAAASVRLLADRARAVRPGFAVTDANAADVARICRALDGMPLAIELAAARLRTMSAAQLTGRLGDRFSVLTGGSRTALPRHQTLRAVVEWSWDLLSKPERVLARRLAVLPAGATLSSAEGICADEPAELGGELPAGAVLDALTGLADKSFLAVDGETDDTEPRYRMLDTIRAYCLEQLTDAEENGVRDRMCGYYLALAETADPLLRTRAQRPWFSVLAAESDNMHAAMRWATEQGDAGTALRFGAALAWYWYLCGPRGACAALALAALAADAAGLPRADRATVEARGICAVIAAGADGAHEPTAEAAELVEAATAAAAADPSGPPPHPLVAYAHAQAARLRGDAEGALDLLAGYIGSADPWNAAAARVMTAVGLLGLGRIEEASLNCDAGLAGFRDIEELWGVAMALMLRAELDKFAGDYGGAIAALEEAADSRRRLNAAPGNDLTWLYSDLAWLRVRTGDYPAAHTALDLVDQNAWAQPDTGPYLCLISAELAWMEGQLGEATRLCEDILREGADRTTSWVSVRPLAAARLGVLELEAGDFARAMALLRDALDTARDRPTAAVAVEGVAASALRVAGAERAAILLGAADSIRGAVDHSSLDTPGIRAAAREQLGQDAFDDAYQRGRGMPYDQAVSFAQASAAGVPG
jgi:predicted ATPase/DNA-binding SARP family transcriptional activator